MLVINNYISRLYELFLIEILCIKRKNDNKLLILE